MTEQLQLDTIYNMDCLEGMKMIPDASVDCIITDPPYDFMTKHQSANYAGAGAFGKMGRSYHGELEKAGIIEGFDRAAIMRECIRVMKKVNICIWCNKDQLLWYMDFFKDYNMDLLTWHKTNPVPTCSNKYLSDTEYCLFFREKGVPILGTYETKKKWWLQDTNKEDKEIWGHPTIKPLNIIEALVLNHSQEGDVVLDPFMGSGTTAVACVKEGRHFIGFELSPEYHKKAVQRVKNEQAQTRLF